jgi:hypothetical protein
MEGQIAPIMDLQRVRFWALIYIPCEWPQTSVSLSR